MKKAIQQLVKSAQYQRFDLVNAETGTDDIGIRIQGRNVWRLMETITTAAGPVLLLLRLADSNAPTLSKLKGTVDYIASCMVDSGSNTLQDKICAAFHSRAHELESDIASAAYVLDPQFVRKSRDAGGDVMGAFWNVARRVLRNTDDADWKV